MRGRERESGRACAREREAPTAEALSLSPAPCAVPHLTRARRGGSGEACSHRRRDLRPGVATGCAALLPDGSLRLTNAWPEPLAGSAEEVFVLVDEATLRVETRMQFSHRPGGAAFSTTYRR